LRQLDDEHVRPIFQRHQGGQVARNRGLSKAEGKYIKFLDDDDWLASGALKKEVNVLNQTGAEICSGGYRVIDEQERAWYPPESNPDDFIIGVMRGDISTHPLSLTYRRRLISHHEWDPDLVGRQDVQFVVDVALDDPSFVCIGEVVATKRNHEGVQQKERGASKVDLTLTHAKILQRAVQVLKEEERLTPQRRRAAAEGLWSWAHILAAYDWESFWDIYKTIERVQPRFLPSRSSRLLGILDQIISPGMTESVLYPARRLKRLI
jgi:glycosyltransferase involved in cell wall biosynthesis